MANVVFRYARDRFLELTALPTDDLIVYVQRNGKLELVPLSSVSWNRAGGSETVESD